MNRNVTEARLKELDIVLPAMPTPVANYVPYRITGNRLYLSGQGPGTPEGVFSLGKVGTEVTVEQAIVDARLCGLRLIAVTQAALGSLDRVTQVVKLLGLVNGAPEFGEHPRVINGCSDLFVEVFGEKGRHARSAMGAGSLPRNMTVEIEAILEFE
ncbi:MAG: RidA family protein [Parasphingorhabdus sp.]|nr:RidA family protein [Parasphingorhabdus sp.]